MAYKSTFYLNPDYQDFIPGITRLRFSTVCAVSIGETLFFVLVSIVLMTFAAALLVNDINLDNRYRAEGQTMTATITGCQMIKPSSKSTSRVPLVDYTYKADGTFTGDDQLTGSCENYPTGSTIQGMYLPGSPEMSEIVTPEQLAEPFLQRYATNLGIFGLPVIVSLFAMYYVYQYIRGLMIYPRLRDQGQLLRGYVVRAESRRRYKRRRYFVYITYGFKTPDGIRLERKQGNPREDLRNGRLPANGAPVQVLYVDDRTHVVL